MKSKRLQAKAESSCKKLLDSLPQTEAEKRLGTLSVAEKDYVLIPVELWILFEKIFIQAFIQGYRAKANESRRKDRR